MNSGKDLKKIAQDFMGVRVIFHQPGVDLMRI